MVQTVAFNASRIDDEFKQKMVSCHHKISPSDLHTLYVYLLNPNERGP